mgnify:CR=1 FL=1
MTEREIGQNATGSGLPNCSDDGMVSLFTPLKPTPKGKLPMKTIRIALATIVSAFAISCEKAPETKPEGSAAPATPAATAPATPAAPAGETK